MKRTTLFAALASALSLSLSAYVHANDSGKKQSEWSKATQRVEGMNDSQSQGQQSQHSDLVKQAQEKLSAMGKDIGTPDGQMDAKTKQALEEYQQQNGLQPTGQLDRQTIAALDLDHAGSAASGGSAADAYRNNNEPKPSDSD